MFHKPLIFSQLTDVLAIETTRLGGVSPAPFATLNLGRSSSDTAENVAENKKLLAAALKISENQFVTGHQTHGTDILVATEGGDFPDFDAKITNQRGLFLTVSVADCVPILIFDKKNLAVAAIHAGWRGTVAHICTKTLQKMFEKYGTHGSDCHAWVGTCIGFEDFEVGHEVAAFFSEKHQQTNAASGKIHVDLKSANRQQLLDFGIIAEQIEVSRFSTIADNDRFFSFRKEGGTTGRFWAAIGLRI